LLVEGTKIHMYKHMVISLFMSKCMAVKNLFNFNVHWFIELKYI